MAQSNSFGSPSSTERLGPSESGKGHDFSSEQVTFPKFPDIPKPVLDFAQRASWTTNTGSVPPVVEQFLVEKGQVVEGVEQASRAIDGLVDTYIEEFCDEVEEFAGSRVEAKGLKRADKGDGIAHSLLGADPFSVEVVQEAFEEGVTSYVKSGDIKGGSLEDISRRYANTIEAVHVRANGIETVEANLAKIGLPNLRALVESSGDLARDQRFQNLAEIESSSDIDSTVRAAKALVREGEYVRVASINSIDVDSYSERVRGLSTAQTPDSEDSGRLDFASILQIDRDIRNVAIGSSREGERLVIASGNLMAKSKEVAKRFLTSELQSRGQAVYEGVPVTIQEYVYTAGGVDMVRVAGSGVQVPLSKVIFPQWEEARDAYSGFTPAPELIVEPEPMSEPEVEVEVEPEPDSDPIPAFADSGYEEEQPVDLAQEPIRPTIGSDMAEFREQIRARVAGVSEESRERAVSASLPVVDELPPRPVVTAPVVLEEPGLVVETDTDAGTSSYVAHRSIQDVFKPVGAYYQPQARPAFEPSKQYGHDLNDSEIFNGKKGRFSRLLKNKWVQGGVAVAASIGAVVAAYTYGADKVGINAHNQPEQTPVSRAINTTVAVATEVAGGQVEKAAAPASSASVESAKTAEVVSGLKPADYKSFSEAVIADNSFFQGRNPDYVEVGEKFSIGDEARAWMVSVGIPQNRAALMDAVTIEPTNGISQQLKASLENLINVEAGEKQESKAITESPNLETQEVATATATPAPNTGGPGPRVENKNLTPNETAKQRLGSQITILDRTVDREGNFNVRVATSDGRQLILKNIPLHFVVRFMKEGDIFGVKASEIPSANIILVDKDKVGYPIHVDLQEPEESEDPGTRSFTDDDLELESNSGYEQANFAAYMAAQLKEANQQEDDDEDELGFAKTVIAGGSIKILKANRVFAGRFRKKKQREDQPENPEQSDGE